MRLSKYLLVTVLSLSIGAHWAILQSVAWCGMIISYSQGSCLTEAVAKTFDGKHPCKLCKAVSAGKKSEKKSEAQFAVKKLDFFSNSELKPSPAPPVDQEFFPSFSILTGRTEAPLTPPPKAA